MSKFNRLVPTNFVLQFDTDDTSDKSLKGIEFQIQRFTTPDISLTNFDSPNPSSYMPKLSSDKIEYGVGSFDIIIGEDMETYLSIIDLMDRTAKFDGNNKLSARLLIYGLHREHIVTIEYSDVMISNISGLSFDLTNQSESTIISTISIDINEIKIKKVK